MSLERPVLKDLRGLLVLKALQVRPDPKVQLVQLVRKEQQGLKDRPESRERLAHKALQVFKVIKDRQASQDSQVLKVSKVVQE